MAESFDAWQQIKTLVARGWRWSETQADVLLHPQDHNLRLRYHEATNSITISPELEKALDLVILTPSSKSRTFR